MIKGIYTSEAAMRPKMTRMEVIANNLANINSTGFKKDRVFLDMLNQSASDAADGRNDLNGVNVRRAVDFTPGSLQPTGNPFDLAIEGDGFFTVETPAGMRLTRNGHFKLGTDGSLLTAEGISGNEAGEAVAGHDPLARLRVVNVDRPDLLQKDHEALFVPTAGQVPVNVPHDQLHVRQGFLEESNVEGVEEMISLIELSRSFETDQKMIQSQDATLDRSMEVGKL